MKRLSEGPRPKYPVGSDKWRLGQFVVGRGDGLRGVAPKQVESNYMRGFEKGYLARRRLDLSLEPPNSPKGDVGSHPTHSH